MSASLQDRSLIYEGSVKRVWSLPEGEDRLWFEYTDDYSIFDWGKMPDTILNKGKALAILGAHFFQRLGDPDSWATLPKSTFLTRFDQSFLHERFDNPVFTSLLKEEGAPSHFKRLLGFNGQPITKAEAANSIQPPFLEVLPAEVNRPEPFTLITQPVYYYPRKVSLAPRRLVPLEVVFRFGMPSGSSLQSRLEKNPSYASVLGLKGVPKPGEWFAHPVLEFFTKLEPKDRLLSIQEALLISGLSGERFEDMIELAYDLALALYVQFAQAGIELWDGKFEFATGREGLMLVDSIGPDELRLLYKGQHLSKEMIRRIYRGGKWEKAIQESQKIAKESGKANWKDICQTRLKSEPEPMPADCKKVVDQLYGTLTNYVVGEPLFKGQPTLDEFVDLVAKLPTGGQ